MNKYVKKIASLFLTVSVLLSSLALGVAADSDEVSTLGKLLDSYETQSGTFTFSKESRIFVVGDAEPEGNLLQTAQLIQRQFAADLGLTEAQKLIWGPENYAKAGDIVLKIDSTAGTDGYILNVTDKAVISGGDNDGLIYGANMLMKFFDANDGVTSLSGFTAADTPDTKERTVHLDLARKYYTVDWVKNFIRQMSWMGYNALELHLSEDGGFRADFWDPDYYTANYQPDNDFSWLCGSHVQSWVEDPYRTDPNADDYLTTKELVQICEVAKEYHIEIIPSFDSPAHMDYITWKFEQNYRSNRSYSFTYGGTTYQASSTSGCINYTGRTGASSPTWPYYTTIDITDGTMAKAFVFALYEDMADFFREYAGSTKFNIGADEVNLSSSYGPKWSYSQFPGYVNSLNRMLNDKGYTVRMYNDFIGSTTYNQKNSKAVYSFDSNIEICYWTSDFHPTTGEWSEPIWHVKFFWENNTGTTDNWGDGGRTMYNCIQTNTYYVLREGTSGTHRDARDPNNRNWTFYGTNEEDIYNKWYPADISEKGVYTENAADVPADQLGGAYFLIWNDYAALNTESEVWNGALDCYDKDRYYYLFDIMYSNIIKMWNSDVNNSVTYSKFAGVRDTFSLFPGYTSCSANANLPVATAPVKADNPNAADLSALNAAIADCKTIKSDKYTAGSYNALQNAITAAEQVAATENVSQAEVDAAVVDLNNAKSSLVDLTDLKSALDANADLYSGNNTDSFYTDDSYNAFKTAYQKAAQVKENANATQEQVNTAAADLIQARSNLTEAPVTPDPDEPVVPDVTPISTNITVHLKALDHKDNTIKTLSFQTDDTSNFKVYIPAMTGYVFDYVENKGMTFTPLASKDGSGHLSGKLTNGQAEATIWYTNAPKLTSLRTLIRGAYKTAPVVSIDGSAIISDTSWNAYRGTEESAYEKAIAYVNSYDTLKEDQKTQTVIDSYYDALLKAQNSLTTDAEVSMDNLILCKKTSASANGKQFKIEIRTDVNVADVNIIFDNDPHAIITYQANFKKLKVTNDDGSSEYRYVKVWAVTIKSIATGSYEIIDMDSNYSEAYKPALNTDGNGYNIHVVLS
ncbi:MAG: hypothetical protein E7631_05425 [Ruminococcaceae bacterium]|nr:hypothetical protein [Oscillospiraceae bacterium]